MNNKITYKLKNKVKIENDVKYLYKPKKKNKGELYKYLEEKNFVNYLPYTKISNDYEIYNYIEDTNLPKEDKALELMNILSMLHTKTTTYQEVNIHKIKELYETIKKEIDYLKNYYLDIQDYIETKEFMSPAEYLLMRNISNIHKALNYSSFKLDSWYKQKETQKIERIALIHNNLKINHFLKDNKEYIISWDKSKKDYIIYDFLTFYKNEYSELEPISLFNLYQSKYKYTKDETLLFQSLIAIPPKVELKKTNYINVIEVKKIIIYVEKTNKFLSEYYKEEQKTNK